MSHTPENERLIILNNQKAIIENEIRDRLAHYREEGESTQEVRERLVEDYNLTAYESYTLVVDEVEASPEAALAFTYSVGNTLDIVNSVLVFENGFAPIMLQELPFVKHVLIDALEDFTGYPIQHLLNHFHNHLTGGIN